VADHLVNCSLNGVNAYQRQDFTDGSGRQRCREVEQLLGQDLVGYTTRSIATGGEWIPENQWVKRGVKGHQFPTLKGEPKEVMKQATYRHMPLVVRTDLLEELENTLRPLGKSLPDPIEQCCFRTLDDGS